MGTRKTDKKRPIRMEDLADKAGMTIQQFFICEVRKYGSVYAAAKAYKMRPSAWAYWKKELGIEVQREVIVTPKD